MNEIISSELEIYLYKSIVKETWVKKNLPNLYNFIFELNGESFSEKVFLYLNSFDKVGKCKICNNTTKFLSISRGYRTYCSKKCSNNDIELVEKKLDNFKKNCLEKWGVDNPMKNGEVVKRLIEVQKTQNLEEKKEKIKKVFLEKWGVDNPSKLDWVKEKKIKTTLKKYNVKNPFQSEEIKNKIVKTNLEKYGVEHPAFSDDITQKKQKTLLDRFGVDNPMKNENVKNKFKETCLQKWGVEHPRKSEAINNKIRQKTIDQHNNSLESIGSPIRVLDITDIFIVNCQKCSQTSSIYKTTFAVRKRFDEIICTVCNPISANTSVIESSLFEFISSLYFGEIIKNVKIEKKEIDIYIPELKIGFEFNGIYWHSSKFKDKSYHQSKRLHFENLDIKVFQIWEDDWRFKKEVVKSMIKNRLGLSNKKIGARKCEIKKIEDNSIVKNFLEENHIQGFVGSKYKIGLFFRDELVSLMTFGELRKSLGQKSQEGHWELLRFCNKIDYNVVGGASKLFANFVKSEKPKKIVSYSKNDYSTGHVYKILNFELNVETAQNYYYVVGGKRVGRFNFRKDKLVQEGFDPNLSEEKIMESRGFYKIWDTGNKKWVWSNSLD